MPKVLIVCASRTGATTHMGEIIAEGLRISNVEAKIVKANEIKNEFDLEGYDALVLGSATYHGDMLQSMKTMLFLCEKVPLEGKIGGAFGAFGWSGEAPERIFDTMKHIFKMNMVDKPLRLKSVSLGGGIQMAQDYGHQIAKIINR